MLIKLTKKKTCADSMACHNDMIKQLKEKYPDLLLEAKTKDDKMHGHLSVAHKNDKNTHIYWVFIYDKTGTHEQEAQGKIEKTKSDRVKKYTGIMPTESEIKKML